MSFDSLLNQTCSVERIAAPTTRDAVGGFVTGWASQIASVKCHIQQVSADERSMNGSIGVEVTHKLFCRPTSSAIYETDRIKVGSVIYDIESINNVAGLGHHYEIMLREIRDGGD